MTKEQSIKIFLVDDDAIFLKLLELEFLENSIYDVYTFATGEVCLNQLSDLPDIIILDYHLDGIDRFAINGLDTLKEIKKFIIDIPVIMLSSQDKIEVAINCMHYGAFDYVVKSETAFLRLEKAIGSIELQKKMKKELNWYMDRM
jgi:DNA-binding NtrC family response regulator